MNNREISKRRGLPTYDRLKRCAIDGTTQRYTDTGKCVECSVYTSSIERGAIDGVRGQGKNPRPEKWCDEMSKAHSESIKRGRKRVKRAEAIEKGLVFYDADHQCSKCGSLRRRIDSGGCYQCKLTRSSPASRARKEEAKRKYKEREDLILDMNEKSFSPDQIAVVMKEKELRTRQGTYYFPTAIIRIILAAKEIVKNPNKYVRKDVIRLPTPSKNREALFNFKPDDLGESARW